MSDYWKKGISGSWDTTLDWSLGVPISGDDVILGTFNSSYAVTLSHGAIIDGLSIGAGATLDIKAGGLGNWGYFLNDGVLKIEKGAEFDAGTLGHGNGYGNGGTIEVNGGTFKVLDNYLSLNNNGRLILSNNANNLITGVGSPNSCTLVNARQTISGAGSITGLLLHFVNSHFGVVNANDTIGLTINTGTETDNAGLIESTNTGGLLIEGNITNEGELKAAIGLLQVTGNVDGNGLLDIAHTGQIELGGYAYQDVQFESGASGTLILDHSDTNPVNEIYGAMAGVHFDLRDIIDNLTTKPSFKIGGSHDEYTLTVTDGTHAANLYLTGGLSVYNTKSFTLGVDGHGGTLVSVV